MVPVNQTHVDVMGAEDTVCNGRSLYPGDTGKA